MSEYFPFHEANINEAVHCLLISWLSLNNIDLPCAALQQPNPTTALCTYNHPVLYSLWNPLSLIPDLLVL